MNTMDGVCMKCIIGFIKKDTSGDGNGDRDGIVW